MFNETFVPVWTNAPEGYDYRSIPVHVEVPPPDRFNLPPHIEGRVILIPALLIRQQLDRYASGLYVGVPLDEDGVAFYDIEKRLWARLFGNGGGL